MSEARGVGIRAEEAWNADPVPSAFTVTRLSTTPIKGLSLHHPESIQLTSQGAVGDRLLYLIDAVGGLQSCTHTPGLYGLTAVYDPLESQLEVSRGEELLHRGVIEPASPVETDMWGLRTIEGDVAAGHDWSTLFSDIVGQRLQLVRARGSAYDIHPVTLLGASSVNELARRAGLAEVDSRRFRMLIEISGGIPHVEDSWHGRHLSVGSATLRAEGPVKRCAATTRDAQTGEVNLQTLRLISSYRGRQLSTRGLGVHFGIYGEVVEPGTISIGDELTLS